MIGRLRGRGAIRLSGPDASTLLQSMVTLDVRGITEHASFCVFLNGRGRVEFDAFLTKDPTHHTPASQNSDSSPSSTSPSPSPSSFLVDVNKDHMDAMLSHLRRYRLRAKVDIDDISNSVHTCVAFGNYTSDDVSTYKLFPDVRLSGLGLRSLKYISSDIEALPFVDDEYTSWRITNGIPEGNDFSNTPLPLDMAVHLLNGISFDKGCYLGQELTARTYHTGVVRKRITPFLATSISGGAQAAANELYQQVLATITEIDPNHKSNDSMSSLAQLVTQHATLKSPKIALQSDVHAIGKKRAVGSVASVHGLSGLAVLRMDDAFDSSSNAVVGNILTAGGGDIAIVPWRPPWWP